MKNIISLTKFLSTILIKQKATLFFVIIAILGILISLAFVNTNIGVEYKLFKDLLLSTDSILLHLITIFFTFSLLEKYKQGSISIIPLSLNITRFQFLISIYATIIISTILIFISFFIIDFISLYLINATRIEPFLLQVSLYYLSSLTLSSVIITCFYFLNATPIKSITIGLITFLVGNSLDELIYFYQNSNSENIKLLINNVSYIFPNFSIFDIQTYVVNNIDFNFQKIFFEAYGYFIILNILLISLSYLKFKNQKVIPNDV